MSRSLAPLRCALALVLLAGPACTTSVPSVAAVDKTTGLDRSFFVRQRVTARVGGETRRFETALESRCGELRLVGLTPFGVRLFSAVRRGPNIEVQSIGSEPLPFPPEYVLRDVERTFFRSQPPGLGEGVEREILRGGERITERWDGGRLVSREIRSSDDDAAADPIVIRYVGATGVEGVPERVELSNPAFGYVLGIDNFEAKEIQCAAVAP